MLSTALAAWTACSTMPATRRMAAASPNCSRPGRRWRDNCRPDPIRDDGQFRGVPEGTPLRTSQRIAMNMIAHIYRTFLFVFLLSVTLLAQTRPHEQRAKEIYRKLIEIDTTDTADGNVTRAAE